MKAIVVGLGIQGKKRKKFAGSDFVASVDTHVAEAEYKHIKDVPLSSYDTALVCVGDDAKFELLTYLIQNKKNVLVEKPMMAPSRGALLELGQLAEKNGIVLYTAYNHRFEPHFINLKNHIDSGALGKIYLAKFFYGNGTARDVRDSVWRDQKAGVLPDLGSHLLDTVHFIFGERDYNFTPWSFNAFENRAFDHFHFGSNLSGGPEGKGAPLIELQATLLSWRNTFRADVFGEKGSAHIECLCKWGPSTFTTRGRVLPSGRPDEQSVTLTCADPTWEAEYNYFKDLCGLAAAQNSSGVKAFAGGNFQNDIWIHDILEDLTAKVLQK